MVVVGSSSPPVILRYQKDGTAGASAGDNRHAAAVNGDDDDGDDPGDRIKCTGNSCKACTAGVIADCVAVCCCPCAVVDCLVLALFKIPWTVVRKCLRRRKKKRCSGGGRGRLPEIQDFSDGISRTELENIGEEMLKDNFSARFDAEKAWLELYQVGHLGFGTEIPQEDG